MIIQPKRSTAKNILYSVISLVILFLIIEGLLSIIFYHKQSDEQLATIAMLKLGKAMFREKPKSVNVPNQMLVRPDSSETVNKQIAEEIHFSNKFQYEPWIEFKNIDYAGKFVNIQNAMRKTVPDTFFNASSKDTLDIYFFGGSTIFGFNVSDQETIPSQFVQLFKEKYPKGKSIRVYNFGTPTYYSYQELIQFTNLIYKGHRPDIVVFIDGVNDFWFAKASYYNQSYFSFVLRQVFNQDLLTTGRFQFKDSSDKMFKDPTNIPLDQYNNGLIANYINNIGNAKMMADLIQAKSYFFCQPVPFYKYPNQQKDPICFKDTATRYNYIYPIIEKKADSIPNFTFLGNMLENETGHPFVDGLHYSPAFTRKFTEQVLLKMERDLK